MYLLNKRSHRIKSLNWRAISFNVCSAPSEWAMYCITFMMLDWELVHFGVAQFRVQYTTANTII